MAPLSCVFVGNESLLVQCARIAIQRGHKAAAVVSHNAEIVAWAEDAGIAVIAPGPGLETRLAVQLEQGFDWLFSVANLTLLPEGVLALARSGAVNFHDGPLPRYAGLNAPVWALLNGEPRHGITWHLIEGAVDGGAIIEQVLFDITAEDTAFSVNARCFASAIESFPSVMAAVEAGVPDRTPQEPALRRLFLRDARPEAAARLDFSQPAAALVRLVRALDHGAYWNPLTLPRIESAAGVFAVTQAQAAAGSGVPGEVLEVGEGAVLVACADGAVRLEGLICLNGLPAAPGTIAAPGEVLSWANAEAVHAVLSRLAAGEEHWRRALAAFRPADLPGTRQGQGHDMVSHALPAVTPERAAAILALFGERIGGGRGMAYAPVPVLASHAAAPADIAAWVPLELQGDCLAALEGSLRASADLTARYPGFPRDLIARDRALAPLSVPHLGISDAAEPIAGTLLCLVRDEAGLHLVGDAARLAPEEIALFAERIAHLAEAPGEAALGSLDLFTARERALLASVNDTASAFDANQTISRAFEAQAARTPDAPALVFESLTLSYGELNARANQVAHVLRGLGVGPDVPVALCVHRSPDLLIGALGILKAGGAYVPMDPAYPAERLAHFLADSGAPVLVTQAALIDLLPEHAADLLVLDTDIRLTNSSNGNPEGGAEGQHLAYLIYTSGSTGKPKGVMVEHCNVANFFAGMDARIRHDSSGVWLAMTSLSFDISVLELFWTLARGFKLVLTSDEGRLLVSGNSVAVSPQKMDFGLFYWGNDDGPGPRKYELLLEGARFADTHGFCAVWTPERHFHAFGGPYPNPAVTGAAVAAVTRNISVRAGSCVAPLHHPLRIAEDWAVIDNLTNGRAALGIASGWHPVDFVLRPENAPPNNKKAMFETIDTLRRLWRGEEVALDRGGEMVAVQSLPRPVSKELPLWLTIAGNPETWREAGEIGANVLTHLLGQSIDEVAEKIRIYHQALRGVGHDPGDFTVTLMLHTYVARSRELARETARGPMKSYLLSAAALVKQYAWSFPAFKRPKGATTPMDIDLRSLSADEVEGILEHAFNRYFEDSGLFGTVEDCLARVEQIKAIGVTEVACLIDYGIQAEKVMEGLYPLAEVVRRANADEQVVADDHSVAGQILRHGVTHLQCTPSMARMLVADPKARAALAQVKNLMIGGEALPGALAGSLVEITDALVQNMYGPTETTIWSTTGMVGGKRATAPIGQPIANTSVHVLDAALRPVPVGAAGELWIGGAGVTRGYWNRPELTAERFRLEPVSGQRIYGTGDLVRMAADGTLEFLGRADHQIKLRGHRIEPGEIEAFLEGLPGIEQAVVVAREDVPGDVRLVAYLVGPQAEQTERLREQARKALPAHLVPGHFVALAAFPLTPNRKIDRKALPAPYAPLARVDGTENTATKGLQAELAAIWSGILGVAEIRGKDNFFALGGHSLLAVQAHREIREKLSLPGLSITDVFRFPVLGDLARHIEKRFRHSNDGATPAAETKPTAGPGVPAGAGRLDAMARRRAMRAGRMGQSG
ncbi:MAG: MupA/Atu3671 family FMN-dependent luciferase-like monooxygenase [Pararhodobacter sp.]